MQSSKCLLGVRTQLGRALFVAEFPSLSLIDMHEEDESPTRNPYKVRAFMSAIKVLKQLDHPLRSIEEAKNVGNLILCRSLKTNT